MSLRASFREEFAKESGSLQTAVGLFGEEEEEGTGGGWFVRKSAEEEGAEKRGTDLKIGHYRGGMGMWSCSGQPLGWFWGFPWSGPGDAAGCALHPCDCLRAGKGEGSRTGAEVFAHGIPPDVAGYRFDRIGGPQNVVVIALFPEMSRGRLAKFEGGVLLEETDKFAEIGKRVAAFGEEMDVVGHYTEGVEEKTLAGGIGF